MYQIIDICEIVKNENKSLSASIVQRQNSKYQRDNISNINHHRQKRRFRDQNVEIITRKEKQYTNKLKIIYRTNKSSLPRSKCN